jgi:hypothetical protein
MLSLAFKQFELKCYFIGKNVMYINAVNGFSPPLPALIFNDVIEKHAKK